MAKLAQLPMPLRSARSSAVAAPSPAAGFGDEIGVAACSPEISSGYELVGSAARGGGERCQIGSAVRDAALEGGQIMP